MTMEGANWLLEGGVWGALLAVALGVAAWAISRRQLRHATKWRRRALPALRGLAVLAVALMAAQPVVSTSQTIRQTGRVTLVIDDTPSMEVADRQLPAGYKLAAARVMGLGGVEQEATALLEGAEALREAMRVSGTSRGSQEAAEELERAAGRALRLLERRGTADAPLATSLREELAYPLQRLVRAVEPASEPELVSMRTLATEWADRLEARYLDEIEQSLARGDSPIVEAVAAFDGLTRIERIERLLSPGGDVRRGLGELGDLRVLPMSELAGGPMTGTDLAAALENASDPGVGRHAVILLSDGRHNTGRPPLLAAQRLGAQGPSLHTVLMAGTTPPADLAVLGVRGPAVVYRDDQLHGRVTVMDAMPPGLPFSVQVRHEGRVLWEQHLTTSGEGARTVEFGFPIATAATTGDAVDGPSSAEPPDRAPIDGGIHFDVSDGVNERLLVLEAVAVLGTDEPRARRDNETSQLPVRVTLGRGRVLVIDGRPRWDTRYLLNMLEREQRWEVRSVLGPPADGERLPSGAHGLPTSREELFAYDVVVLGEVPVEWLGMQWPTWLRQFVDERGGGLVLLDGGRGVLSEYATTPLGEAIPVVHDANASPAGGRLELTGAGEQEEALRLEGEGFANARLWGELPAPRQLPAVSVKPGMGRVLVVAGVGVDGEDRRPVMVRASFGRGRVWWQGLDETWRWRREAEGRWQTRLWSGVMSQVMEPPFAAEDERASIGVDRAAVRAGEAIGVRARVRDEAGLPLVGEEAADLIATARLLRDGIEVTSTRLLADPGTTQGGGLLRGELRAPTEPGLYEVGLSLDRYSDAELTARAPLLVREPDLGEELGRLAGDADLMSQLAAAGGGVMLREWEAGRLIDLIGDLSRTEEVRRRYKVWASWPLFAVAVGLLGLEWVLRRRAGMM